MVKIGIIRVLTTNDENILYAHERIIKRFLPSTEFVTRAILDQSHGIYDLVTEQIAVPKIVSLAGKMEKDGCNGLIISCCADPALELVKKAVAIPVIGAGQAACLMAQAVSSKIGVISLIKDIPENLKNQLGKNLIAYSKIEGVNNTLDLLTPEGKEKVILTVRQLLKKKAGCILLGCTGLATIGIAEIIEKELAVPVIDPIVASGMLINYLIQRSNWQVKA